MRVFGGKSKWMKFGLAKSSYAGLNLISLLRNSLEQILFKTDRILVPLNLYCLVFRDLYTASLECLETPIEKSAPLSLLNFAMGQGHKEIQSEVECSEEAPCFHVWLWVWRKIKRI